MKILTKLAVILVLTTVTAFGSGFQINDLSARSVAMGFSTVANPTDASGIFFNPAAITDLNGTFNFSLGSSFIAPGASFTGITSMNQQNTYDMENWNFLVPHFYFTWKTPVENLSLGAGMFIPFGLGTKWDPNWIGRHLANETYLQTIEINPNIAYKFDIAGMPLSLAAGFGYAIGNVSLKKTIATFNPEPVLKLDGDGSATTFNFGLDADITKDLKLGVSYRHNIKMEYSGNTTFENIDGLEALFQEGTGKATINLPNDLRVGISYNVTSDLSVEAGINYMGWASYDTLKVEFDKAPGNPSTSYTSADARLYKNTITYRIGAEYKCENMEVRVGAYYDPIPVDSKYVEPVLPENNRLGLSAGLGFDLLNNLKADIGYLGILGSQTNVEGSPSGFDGYYNAWANIVSLTISYSIK